MFPPGFTVITIFFILLYTYIDVGVAGERDLLTEARAIDNDARLDAALVALLCRRERNDECLFVQY